MRGNILVVDDEPGPRESLRMILKNDHDVRTASSGEEALLEVERMVPDLVLLDLRMPGGMDGTEVLKQIKTAHPDVQVAIITAYAAVDSARLAVRYGALDYLTKPYSVSEVERVVEKALKTRRQRHDAAVLVAQLAKMTDMLGREGDHLEHNGVPDVAGDIKRLRSAQTELSEDLDAVRALSELGEVAAEVTHDINNLLTIILSDSQSLLLESLARPGNDPNAAKTRLTRIVQAAEDCAAMIRRIKDFVRANVSFDPVPLDVNEIVQSVVEMKREALPPQKQGVRFVTELSPVPPIQGEEVALRTMLLNLIENSLDAIEGEGLIELSTEPLNGGVQIRVRDTGCGMPPEIVERATQAFFSTKKGQGTGLGLSITQRIVRRHKGSLSIKSVPGEGTTITIQLPLTTPSASSEQKALHEPAARGTVILVDDDPPFLDLMTAVLESDGYQVLEASEGMAAWSLLQSNYQPHQPKPLMVIADHEMPGMSGRELAQRVKGLDPRIPVLLVSGYVSQHEGPEDALLTKPFDLRQFLDAVESLITTSRVGAD